MNKSYFEHYFGMDGYMVFPNAVPRELLDAYRDKYPRDVVMNSAPYSSYFSSRFEFLDNKEILDIACLPTLNKVFAYMGKYFRVHMSEARVGSSSIKWHRDFNPSHIGYGSSGYIESGDEYMGLLVAISDAQEGSGYFELVPGSHKWETDYSVVTRDNLMNNPDICFDYYEKLIHDKRAATFEFVPRSGDMLLWHGSLIHRGKQPDRNGLERESLLIHYAGISHDDIIRNTYEESNLMAKEYPGSRMILQGLPE
jgi:ectoine hydroxylase-related dioxygenase (phytanoyl-CoA dioxygenase family)